MKELFIMVLIIIIQYTYGQKGKQTCCTVVVGGWVTMVSQSARPMYEYIRQNVPFILYFVMYISDSTTVSDYNKTVDMRIKSSKIETCFSLYRCPIVLQAHRGSSIVRGFDPTITELDDGGIILVEVYLFFDIATSRNYTFACRLDQAFGSSPRLSQCCATSCRW